MIVEQMKEKHQYLHLLQKVNGGKNELARVIFYPGMKFGSNIKWWPDEGKRVTPHEGIDFCYFLDSTGDEWVATPDFQAPAMAEGVVYAIVPDYLGQTLFLAHGCERSSRFLSVYAHIEVLANIAIGDQVCAADVLGTLADTSGRRNRMPNHLHFSLLLVEKGVPPGEYDWNLICYSPQAKLLDPMQVLGEGEFISRRKNHWKEGFGLRSE